MSTRDFKAALVIGAAVGILVQPILLNIHGLEYVSGYVSLGVNTLRGMVFVVFLLLAPLALWLAAQIGRSLPGLYQFAKFAAVGSLNSFLDIGVLNLEAILIHQDPKSLSTVGYFLVKSVSFLVATTNSYLWNKNWTFGDQSRSRSETIAVFYGITALTYFLNTGVATYLKVHGPLFHLEGNLWAGFLAPVAGILVAMFGNFFGYKYLVFGQTKGSQIQDNVP